MLAGKPDFVAFEGLQYVLCHFHWIQLLQHLTLTVNTELCQSPSPSLCVSLTDKAKLFYS